MAQRLALIIGNSVYLDGTLSRLLTPDADVGALGELLLDPERGGFDDVKVMVNMSSHIIRRAIASFFSKKTREDLLVLYFSGHGVLDDQGQLFLAVRDTDSRLLSGTAIPASYVTSEMNNSHSQRQVLILDCCHSGAFARGAKGQIGSSVGTATAFEGTGFGRVVLTASDATQFAWEGDQVIGQAENSLFTHYLVEGIQTGKADLDSDEQITVDELYDYTYEQVVRQTPKQTPGKWSYKEQGEIVLARAPLLASISRMSVQIPDLNQDQEQRLEQLYNEGLSAFWLEEWDKAVRCFEALVELRGDYLDAVNKLGLSRRNKRLLALYNQAIVAEEAGDWPQAIARLEELASISPAYKDTATRLDKARRAMQLANLYHEARHLAQAEKWQAVVNVFSKIADFQPGYPDPDGLLPAAQTKVAEIERLETMASLYNRALREMDAGSWDKARELLTELEGMEAGYRGADRLLAKVEARIAEQRAEQEHAEQIASLYRQAVILADAGQWAQAMEKIQAIQELDAQFDDPNGIEVQAQAEIQRQKDETQRQMELSASYGQAVQLLESGQYQQALEQWGQVQALDPAYPDRQKVQATAKKKLRDLTQVGSPKPRLPRWALAALGLAGVLIIALIFANSRSGKLFLLKNGIPISDHFGQKLYEGSYNPNLWTIWKGDPAYTIAQRDGNMELSAEGINPENDYRNASDLQLIAAKDLSLNKLYYVEANMMVVPSSGAHLGLFFGLPGGYAECQIQAQNDQICCWTYPQTITQQIPPIAITPGSWHKIRIELSKLDPVAFKFLIDDVSYGTWRPLNSGNTDRISNVQVHLISYENQISHGYVDYMSFGTIR